MFSFKSRVLLGRFRTVIYTFVILLYSSSVFGADNYKVDFDGDGMTDISVCREGVPGFPPYNPSYWYILNSSSGQVSTIHWGSFIDDDPVPADYDGDNITDIAVFRYQDEKLNPEFNLWILQSSGGYSIRYFPTGIQKISRNYLGDGKAEIGHLYPIDLNEDPVDPCYAKLYEVEVVPGARVGKWVEPECNEHTFGEYVAPGDYNNDGLTDIAVFRRHFSDSSQSHFEVWWDFSPLEYSTPDETQLLDVQYPTPVNYDGDSFSDFAGYDYLNGSMVWKIRSSSTGLTNDVQFGLSGDKPVQGDYDGDGKTDIAIFRPSTSTWWIRRSSDGGVTATAFGSSTDVPLPMTDRNYY